MRTGRAAIVLASLGAAIVLTFFEVSVNICIRLPRDAEVPDASQEARYEACTSERDARIHRQAFDTIDNPDVQREYITLHRKKARHDCRRQFPERTMTVRQGFRFHLLDVEPRFGLHYRHGEDTDDPSG